MNVDGFTLFLILILISWTGVFAVGFLWASNRTVVGVKYWFYSQLLYGIASLLRMTRDITGDLVSIFFANTLYFLSMIIFVYGHVVFLRQKQPAILYAVLTLFFFSSFSYFFFIHFNTSARIIILSTLLIVSTAYIAGQYWTLWRSHYQSDHLFAVVALTLSVLVHGARIIGNVSGGQFDLFDTLTESPLLHICMFWTQFIQLFVLFALVNACHLKNLRFLANHDPLTNTLNRRSFMNIAERIFMRLKIKNQPLALLMIDVDWFKSINDTHGHPVGDEVLRSLASTLKQELRPGDLIGRYGGEEFCVLLEDTPEDTALDVAERVRKAVEERSIVVGAVEVNMSISVGLSILDDDMTNFSDMLRHSDKALYKAKENGRNTVYSLAA